MEDNIIKNCLNCAHLEEDKCLKSGYYYIIQRQYPDQACDVNFSGWQSKAQLPPPIPRRSLAQWLYDTFFRLNK